METIQDLWNKIKHANIHPLYGSQKEGIKNVFEEIITENFQTWRRETDIQVQEA